MDVINHDPDVIDITDDDDVVAEPSQDPPAEISVDESEAVAADNSENLEESLAENGESNEVNVEEEANPFADEDDSDEEGGGVQVTIRKIEPTEKPTNRTGKLDIDATPMINDKPIYDLDLAQMEDRPWRKPGADITDYFNYGFTEETWNMYCERQKKLRVEFSGNQQASNNALFSSIKLSNPLANPVMNNPSSSVVKVLTDNGGRFKQPSYNPPSQSAVSNDQVIRTVITGNNAVPLVQGGLVPNPLMDFTKPPPGMALPPMGMPPVTLPTSATEAPPGVDGGSDRPPGVESLPGVSAPSLGVPGVPGVPGGLDLHLGIPPPGFNPNMPPPGMLGLMATNLPPPQFSMPPPSFQQHSRAGFGQVGMGSGAGGPRSLVPSGPFPSREISDDDEERRLSRRKRSRSRSPSRRDRDRERDSRRRSDRDSERTSSRRHRSRSTSGDRRRRRDERERDRDREKRRDRRDDDDRKKRSRRDDDEDRKESSSSKKEKVSKSRGPEEESAESTGVQNEESPVIE